MRLTKVEFVNAVENYKKMRDSANEISEALEIRTEFIFDKFLDHYYNLLHDLCDFPEDKECLGSILDDFVCEWDFGRKWHEGALLVDGKDMPLRNAEELYDAIVLLYGDRG